MQGSQASHEVKQTRYFIVNTKMSLFVLTLISVSDQNPYFRSHEDANDKIILTAFELIIR